jgi:hypothetical protein
MTPIRQVLIPAACHRDPGEFSRALAGAATTAESHSGDNSPFFKRCRALPGPAQRQPSAPGAAAHAKRRCALSGKMPFKAERVRLAGRRLPHGFPPVISNDGQTQPSVLYYL